MPYCHKIMQARAVKVVCHILVDLSWPQNALMYTTVGLHNFLPLLLSHWGAYPTSWLRVAQPLCMCMNNPSSMRRRFFFLNNEVTNTVNFPMRAVILANLNHPCQFKRPQKSTCDTVMLRKPIFSSVFGGISQKQKARLWSRLELELAMLIPVFTGTVTFYFFPKSCPTTVLNADSSALRTFLQQLRGEYSLQRTSNHCFTFTPHISCTTPIDLSASLLCTTIRCLMLCSNKEWQYNLRSCFSCLSVNIVKAGIAFALSPTIKLHCFLLLYKSVFHFDF